MPEEQALQMWQSFLCHVGVWRSVMVLAWSAVLAALHLAVASRPGIIHVHRSSVSPEV